MITLKLFGPRNRLVSCFLKLVSELSYSKVRAMTRAATPDNEEFLLRIAKHGTASHVEKLVRQHERVERLSRDDQGEKQQAAREFSYFYDDDGMLVFRGRLTPEDGAMFLKAMDAVLHQMNEETFQREREEEPSLEAVKNVSAETFSQKRADALARMAEHTLATAKDGTTPLSGGDKYQVVVHINANPVREHHQPGAWIESGPSLSLATVKRLASDASLVTVLEDKSGNVLNIGRKTRTIPPAIRRALFLRDRGCRFPGCCESKYVDAHHIRHWCDGGETSLDNLVLLCRHHHRLVHEEGYGIGKDGAGNPVFLTPALRRVDHAPFPQFPEQSKNVSAETFLEKLEIENRHDALGVAIDSRTAVTAWRGEVMDYGMAVEALQNRQSADRI